MPTLVLASDRRPDVRSRKAAWHRRADPGCDASSSYQATTTSRGSATRTQILDEVEEFLTGVRRGPDPDRVLATVLFTDIVGSTERAAELGDRRWRELLDAHHDSVFGASSSASVAVRLDTAGDGFLATFDGPGASRSAAPARSATQCSRSGLEIRPGVHTGEVELDGDDVGRHRRAHGRASWQLAADPREVLVSSTVKDLVAGSGIEFEERGEHELKGVPGTWRLYAVVDA